MKAALFLGAGASVFAGQPATADLMDILRKRIPDDMSEITKTIVESGDYADIEQLYDGIDRMLDVRDAKHDIRNIKPIIRAMHDGGGEFKTTLDELQRLKSIINDILREKLAAHDNIGDIVSMYNMVTSVIKDHVADGLWVFTTNYDTVVEAYAKEIGRELVNGFQHRESTNDVWLNEWDSRPNKPLYLVKLHGSMHWYMDGEQVLEAKVGGKRTTGNSVLIAPTEGAKDYGKEPFRELKERFKKELESVDVLLVIGFSYRDEELVKIIKAQLDRGMALISVSPRDEEFEQRVSNGFNGEVPVGDKLFRTKGRIVLINEKFEPDTVDGMRDWLTGSFRWIRD